MNNIKNPPEERTLSDYDREMRLYEKDLPEWKKVVYERGLEYIRRSRDSDAFIDFMMAHRCPDNWLPSLLDEWLINPQKGDESYVTAYMIIKLVTDKLGLSMLDSQRTVNFMKEMYSKNIFPDLMDNTIRNEMYKKSFRLYHAVPEKYVDTFEKGTIVLDKASNIRMLDYMERRPVGFFSEGMIYKDVEKISGDPSTLFMDEFFFFCTSFSKDINKSRELINTEAGKYKTYKVNWDKLLPAISDSIKNKNKHSVENGGGWRYYTGDGHEKIGSDVDVIDPLIVGCEIQYITTSGIVVPKIPIDTCFYKHHSFKDEEEFRLAFKFQCMPKESKDSILTQTRILTTTNNDKLLLQINPEGCFEPVDDSAVSAP